jgi:Mn-dependent DtxR family transcriptional regulator
MNVVIEFKDLLMQTEDYLEVICLFVTEKDGFFNKGNVIEIMKNF